MRGFRGAVLPVGAALALATTGHAAEIELDRALLCAEADVVVVAEVTSLESRWIEGDDGAIETRVWLSVQQVVRGDAPATVEIALAGGQVGDWVQLVENAPALMLDRSYLLFLAKADVPSSSGLPVFRPYAGLQSAVAVQRHPRELAAEPLDDVLDSLGACHAP